MRRTSHTSAGIGRHGNGIVWAVRRVMPRNDAVNQTIHIVLFDIVSTTVARDIKIAILVARLSVFPVRRSCNRKVTRLKIVTKMILEIVFESIRFCNVKSSHLFVDSFGDSRWQCVL
jgi:hypothetical protein